MFKNVAIWRYDRNYNMTEIAVIPNITSHHLQLKQKHQILAKHWLIHPKCVTVFEIDAGGTWNGTDPIYATQAFPIFGQNSAREWSSFGWIAR